MTDAAPDPDLRRAPDADAFERATGHLVGLGGRLAALMIVAMTALVATNVLFRAIPGLRSFKFAEEYTGYFFVALAFLGLADTLRHGGHVRVTLLLHSLAPRVQAVLEIGLTLVALPVVAIIGWFGGKLFWHSLQTGEVAQTVMQTPLWIPRLSIPVGCALLILALISHIRRNWQASRRSTGQSS
ncbi:MAG: hypothetical protein CMN19_14000 [Roseovarius sp.]|nr:hypothetical protein [Roseovarius sp.]